MQGQQEQANAEKGEKTGENVRYGQAISEGGFGGKTAENSGGANQGMFNMFRSCPAAQHPLTTLIAEGGFGGAEKQAETGNSAKESREAQDYGPGTGIGA